MCVDKTIQRLDKLWLNDDFKNFFAQVERLLFENVEEYFSVIHGDLCLPNILVEEEHKFLRLVDPREKFGDFDIYGDWRYDLAKMLHSLEGNYDFIIADKFKVNVQGAAIDYEFALDFAPIREKFFEVFAGQLKDLPALRLIEATLFLSMIPLYADSLSHQQVMLARGVELFEAVMEQREVRGFGH